MIMPHLTGAHWINTDKPGGRVYFVGGGAVSAAGRSGTGKGASDNNSGLTPEQPLSTIDGTEGAFAKVTADRGDTIVVLPGTVTITAAIAFDTADVTLMGVSAQGNRNPSEIAVNGAIDGISVTGANAVIENLHFPAAGTASQTAVIDCGAAGTTIRGCTFAGGTNNLDTITIPAAGLHTLIENNRFYIEGNGPDSAVVIEDAAAHYVDIKNNVFHGMNVTNSWDEAAIESTVAHLDCLVTGNQFIMNANHGIEFSAAATGIISHNLFGNGTLASMLDPGSCMCFENYEADAVNESARIFPAGIAI
jgi:hypothetical protein